MAAGSNFVKICLVKALLFMTQMRNYNHMYSVRMYFLYCFTLDKCDLCVLCQLKPQIVPWLTDG